MRNPHEFLSESGKDLLDSDLDTLYKEGKYSLSFLKDIQNFRNLDFETKKEEIKSIFGLEEKSKYWEHIEDFFTSHSEKKFNYLYQGYKENFFTKDHINPNGEMENWHFLWVLTIKNYFFLTFPCETLLSLFRENYVTWNDIGKFTGSPCNIIEVEILKGTKSKIDIGSSRLEAVLTTSFLEKVRNKELSFHDVIDLSIEDIRNILSSNSNQRTLDK